MLEYEYTQEGFVEVVDKGTGFVVAYLGYDDVFGQWELQDLETSLCVVELHAIIEKLAELNGEEHDE